MSSPQESTPFQAGVPWQDFDLEDVFETTKTEAAAAACQNFVLEFGADRARIVRDLSTDHFKVLLNQEPRDTHYPIRWM